MVWWWAQGGTALPRRGGRGYRDTDDPAITVRLALTDAAKQALNLEGENAPAGSDDDALDAEQLRGVRGPERTTPP